MFRVFSSSIFVEFHRVGRSANGFVDSLAKQGFDRSPVCCFVHAFFLFVVAPLPG